MRTILSSLLVILVLFTQAQQDLPKKATGTGNSKKAKPSKRVVKLVPPRVVKDTTKFVPPVIRKDTPKFIPPVIVKDKQ